MQRACSLGACNARAAWAQWCVAHSTQRYARGAHAGREKRGASGTERWLVSGVERGKGKESGNRLTRRY
eukprot:5015870-Pleurochrysis_carterae.AAC.1